MIVKRYRSAYATRLVVITLFLTAAYSPVAVSQETKKETAVTCTPSDTASPCPSAAPATEIPPPQSRQVAYLPDAPQPQYQSDPAGASLVPGQDKNSAVLFLPVKTAQLPSFADKFSIYVHQTFGPPAVIVPAFTAGMALANPKSHYPREWKDGPGAFGRNYGDALAIVGSQRTARFLTGAALHEDPRYVRSSSKNPLMRTAHALCVYFRRQDRLRKKDHRLLQFRRSRCRRLCGQRVSAPWIQRSHPRGAKNGRAVREHCHSEYSRRISAPVGTALPKTAHQQNPSRMVGPQPRKVGGGLGDAFVAAADRRAFALIFSVDHALGHHRPTP